MLRYSWLPLLLWGCAILNPISTAPTPRAMTPHIYPDSIIRAGIAVADAIVTGTVTDVQEADDYEVLCHFPTQLQGCRPQDAWRVDVGHARFWTFPPIGNYLPIAKGMQAIFLARNVFVIPYAKCDHMGQFRSVCLRDSGEYSLVVLDTLDILPLSDTTRVRHFVKELHR